MEEQLQELTDVMNSIRRPKKETIELDHTDLWVCMKCISQVLKEGNTEEPSVVKSCLENVIAYTKQEFPRSLMQEDIDKLLDC